MYTSLYVKTNYSILSSLITIDKYIDYAKLNNLTSLAITDDNMYGVMEFYKKCKLNNIKPIIGLELSINNNTLLLYAKDYDGYKTLLKLSSIKSCRDLLINDIEMYHKSVIGIVPIDYLDFYNEVKNIIDDLYLGYKDKLEEKDALQVTNNVVFIRESLYIEEKEKDYLKYLYLIKDGKTISDDVLYEVEKHELNIKDIYELTSNSSLFNTNRISDKCTLEINKSKALLPSFKKDNMTSSEYLKQLATFGLNKRLNGIPNNYLDRLNYELDIIDKMGFSDYFLVVYDFIKYAKKNNILVGPGRGSAVGSLVCYSIGITEIDPLKYDLLFERFLNPERVTMPDIDTDFPDIYRNQVIDYVKEKYGLEKVAGIIAFDTLAAKQALRDCGRILNIPLYQIDILTKKITNPKMTLSDAYKNDSEFNSIINSDDKLKLLYSIALRLEGFPRNTSVHAAGIVISSVNLDEVVPVITSSNNKIIAYEKDYLEELGLIKMDFLGVTALTTIMNIINDIKKYENIDLDFNNIDLNDSDTLKLFASSKTTGIFQFESDGMKNFLRKLRPDNINDIFAAIALFRPGANKNIDTYIKRKHKEESITYLDPSLESILNKTYGIIVYQEDVIKIAVKLAGYSMGEADILRSAMSKKKKEILINERSKFISRGIENGYSEEVISKIYDLILEFAGYGFNKSHAVAYSIVAYKMAYLKAHFSKYFYSNLLSSDSSKALIYIREAKASGLNILKPDINKSGNTYVISKEGIYYPFSGIKDIGTKISNDIVSSRGNGYEDIFDFILKNPNLNKKNLETLIKAGVFDSFGINRKTLITNIDELNNYKDLVSSLDKDFVLIPELKEEDEYSNLELVGMEKELFGFYLSNHPVSTYKLQDNRCISLNDIAKYFNKNIECIVLVERIKSINTKKGDSMMFISASDEYDRCDFTVFPKLYEECKNIKVGNIIKVYGHVERRYDLYQIIANKIDIII